MKGLIRVCDVTTGRGVVLSGSTSLHFGGTGVAYEGDPVSCLVPGRGRTVIAGGHSAFRDNGVPVDFDGHRCACWCVLISSMPSSQCQLSLIAYLLRLVERVTARVNG